MDIATPPTHPDPSSSPHTSASNAAPAHGAALLRTAPRLLHHWPASIIAGLAFLVVLSLTGCDFLPGGGGSDDGGGDDGGAPGDAPVAAVYVSNNGPDNAGDVDLFDQDFQSLGTTYQVGNNEGVAFDDAGNLYQAGDGAQTSIRIFTAIASRSGGAFDPDRDREIIGSNTGLMAPKGIDVKRGFIFVADFGASDIKVFRAAAAGNAAPVATTSLPDAAPWDVVYDAETDRLFASLTNGTVAVFDAYLGDRDADIGAGGRARMIVPVDAKGDQTSINLHGIALDRMRDALVVTDVGDAADAGDGSIYVIEEASTADGNVRPVRSISGDVTRLGNPVDVILNGTDALIAEKANDRLLIYRNIFSGQSGNLIPDVFRAQTKPESIAIDPMAGDRRADLSDLEHPGTTINALLATANPAGLDDDALLRLSVSRTEQATWGQFKGITSIQSIKLDANADAYLTFDGEDNTGGVMVISQLLRRPTEGAVGNGDRRISGSHTGFVAPKGLDLTTGLGLLFVADFGAANVKVFSAGAAENAAPLFTIDRLGSSERSVWDVDYDPEHDRLFVAATDGTVLICDRITETQGADRPTRVVTPVNQAGEKISVNLHGINYIARADVLLLSDVGDAANPDDGQVFVIRQAALSNNMKRVHYQLGGDKTRLGNPVDLTFDGVNTYIAEKSNDAVLRLDNIMERSGEENTAPNQITAVTKAESVVLVPAYLDTDR